MVANNCRGSERTWSFLWSADVVVVVLISDVVVMRGLLHAAGPSRCGSVVEGWGAEERQILRSSCCSSYWWGAARRLLRQMSFTPFQLPLLLRRMIIARLLHKLWVYVGSGLVALGCNRPDQEREQARVTIQEAVHRTNKNKNKQNSGYRCLESVWNDDQTMLLPYVLKKLFVASIDPLNCGSASLRRRHTRILKVLTANAHANSYSIVK